MGSHAGRARSRRAGAPHGRGTRRDRARVLRRPLVPRGRRAVGRARGHGEEPDPFGAGPAPGCAGRERDGGAMARELSHQELDDLLGAFALDAVDGEEREQVEQYLERSPRARAVVAEYRQTAAFLAPSGTEAPPGLWDRIEDRLAEGPAGEPPQLERPTSERVVSLPRRWFSSPWTCRAAASVTAAAALLVVAL